MNEVRSIRVTHIHIVNIESRRVLGIGTYNINIGLGSYYII